MALCIQEIVGGSENIAAVIHNKKGGREKELNGESVDIKIRSLIPLGPSCLSPFATLPLKIFA